MLYLKKIIENYLFLSSSICVHLWQKMSFADSVRTEQKILFASQFLTISFHLIQFIVSTLVAEVYLYV